MNLLVKLIMKENKSLQIMGTIKSIKFMILIFQRTLPVFFSSRIKKKVSPITIRMAII